MCAALCSSQAHALPKQIPREFLDELTGAGNAKLAEREVKALYGRFRRLAPQGYLLPDQFRKTMGVIGMSDDPFLPDRMFRIFDRDQNGKLSFVEFASSLAIMIRGSEEDKVTLSFEMTAGQRNAKGINLEDFEKLMQACNTMMRSLVAPTTGPTSVEDIHRMFDMISTPVDETNAESGRIITLDDYKNAVATNDEFLSCLGLVTLPGPAVPSSRKTVKGAPSKDQLMASLGATGIGPVPQGYTIVSQQQLEELQARVEVLRAAYEERNRAVSSLSSPAQPDIEKAEPKKTRIQRGNTAQEFDEVLGWCRQQVTRAESGGEFSNVEFAAARGTTVRITAGSPRSLSTGEPGPSLRPSVREPVGVSVRRNTTKSDALTEASGHRATVVNVHGTSGACGLPPDGEAVPGTPGSKQPTGAAVKRSHASKRRRGHRLLGPKKGLAVHFGHENWNMVLSMMIGIRMAAGRSKNEMSREIQPVDFLIREKFSIIPRLANIFDSEVSKRVHMTRFIDFAPMAFQKIRDRFGIKHDEYLRSVGPEQLLGNMVLGNLSSLSELSSEGKSGAFFYYTADGKYMMKTVSTKEFKLLIRMFPAYYQHMMDFPSTMLCRFLGLHCLSVQRKSRTGMGTVKRKLFFVVMGNMFNTPFPIHRRYDLKGSWIGRVTPELANEANPNVALKDVDFTQRKEQVNVGKDVREALLVQIEKDAHFLRDNNIIDYSLLLGIHNVGTVDELGEVDVDGPQGDDNPNAESMLQQVRAEVTPTALLMQHRLQERSQAGVSLPTGEEAVPLHQRDLGGLLSTDRQSLYLFGIIDILTPYDYSKVAEHKVKAVRNDWHGVSCCPPAPYAKRFEEFMQKAFVEA